MYKFLILSFSFMLFISCKKVEAQPIDSLRLQIEQLLSSKNAKVGISIMGSNGSDTLSINGNGHFPMQSVFKFHLALAVLAEVDKGNLSLTQPILFTKDDLHPKTWSPMRDLYPNGGTITLAKMLEFTVSQSDNNGCDILFELVGGTAHVEQYFKQLNFNNISIKVNEREMHEEWDIQFQNWTTPIESSHLLKAFYLNDSLLSPTSYKFIWETMKATSTGLKRLKSQLPNGTIVAHKTGTSGTNDATGIKAAVNDIGIVFLPNGEYFIISAYVGNSKEDEATNEQIIADIAKLTWDYFIDKSNK